MWAWICSSPCPGWCGVERCAVRGDFPAERRRAALDVEAAGAARAAEWAACTALDMLARGPAGLGRRDGGAQRIRGELRLGRDAASERRGGPLSPSPLQGCRVTARAVQTALLLLYPATLLPLTALLLLSSSLRRACWHLLQLSAHAAATQRGHCCTSLCPAIFSSDTQWLASSSLSILARPRRFPSCLLRGSICNRA